jgi:hypothetical protein
MDFPDSLNCFLEKGVLILYPFVNLDGYYEYVKGGNWNANIRKNMNGNHKSCGSGYAGVDINRNFPSNFATVPESRHPCGEEYHGPAPFSEEEAKVFQEIFSRFKVVIAVDIHSFGNEWIYPYASDATDSKLAKRENYPVY